jgi:hypothetical protein
MAEWFARVVCTYSVPALYLGTYSASRGREQKGAGQPDTAELQYEIKM